MVFFCTEGRREKWRDEESMMVCRQLADVMIGLLGRVPFRLRPVCPFVIESYSICKSTLSTISLHLFGCCRCWWQSICYWARAHFARGIKSDAACCVYLIFYLLFCSLYTAIKSWLPSLILPTSFFKDRLLLWEHSNRSGNCKLMSKYCVCSPRTNVSCVSSGDESSASWGQEWNELELPCSPSSEAVVPVTGHWCTEGTLIIVITKDFMFDAWLIGK